MPLVSYPAPCWPIYSSVVHWILASHRVLHLNERTLWLSATIATSLSECFSQAALGSPEIVISHSIYLCICLPVLIWQMFDMPCPSLFFLALVPAVFLINLIQWFPLQYPLLLARTTRLLLAAMRYHQNLHSSTLNYLSCWSQTVEPMLSSRWLVLPAGH